MENCKGYMQRRSGHKLLDGNVKHSKFILPLARHSLKFFCEEAKTFTVKLEKAFLNAPINLNIFSLMHYTV